MMHLITEGVLHVEERWHVTLHMLVHVMQVVKNLALKELLKLYGGGLFDLGQ